MARHLSPHLRNPTSRQTNKKSLRNSKPLRQIFCFNIGHVPVLIDISTTQTTGRVTSCGRLQWKWRMVLRRSNNGRTLSQHQILQEKLTSRPNNILLKFLSELNTELKQTLLTIFNKIWKESTFPHLPEQVRICKISW